MLQITPLGVALKHIVIGLKSFWWSRHKIDTLSAEGFAESGPCDIALDSSFHVSC